MSKHSCLSIAQALVGVERQVAGDSGHSEICQELTLYGKAAGIVKGPPDVEQESRPT